MTIEYQRVDANPEARASGARQVADSQRFFGSFAGGSLVVAQIPRFQYRPHACARSVHVAPMERVT
jgi:hypothetical protein